MRDAHGARSAVGQPGDGLGGASGGGVDETQAATHDGLPAWIGEPAGDREGVLEQLAGRVAR